MTAMLDIENHAALLVYLRDEGHIGANETPAIRTLAGGVSNKTVLVERANGVGWVLKQALGKLRVKVDWFSSPERIQREALGMRYLAALTPPGATTPLIFEDPRYNVLAMHAVPQPHENWKSVLLNGEVDINHVAQFGCLLGTIHRAAYERRAELAPLFADRSFFESLRVEPYYVYTGAQVPSSAAFYDALIHDTRAQQLTLVHGDYSPKNILVYNQQLVLLDHEVIHWGDPAFDLGFALTHLLSKAHHLPIHRAAFDAAAAHTWQTYRSTLGNLPWSAVLEARVVRHTLGCLLARVAGRSTLEYLNAEERARQQAVVVRMMANAPATIEELIRVFIAEIE